jgi:DNA-binding CsgD family transcriptional regulator
MGQDFRGAYWLSALGERRMTLQERIAGLAQEGLSNKEIAQRLGCRPEYVRTAKRRADSAKRAIDMNPSQPPTLQSQIVVLVAQGCGDIEIAERLGCRREYVRVARRRAGLVRSEVAREAALRRTEEKLIAFIGSLEAKLADAKRQLAELQKRPSSQAGPIAASDDDAS